MDVKIPRQVPIIPNNVFPGKLNPELVMAGLSKETEAARTRAWKKALETPFPHTKDEDWRWLDFSDFDSNFLMNKAQQFMPVYAMKNKSCLQVFACIHLLTLNTNMRRDCWSLKRILLLIGRTDLPGSLEPWLTEAWFFALTRRCSLVKRSI